MYTKEEASAVRQKFWTSFGKYMQPVSSASGEDVHWINYKTGIKGIAFKMNADNNKASVIIEISLPDKDIQNKYFDVFKTNEKSFIKLVGADWAFEKEYSNDYGKTYSCVYTVLNGINIFRETDWPTIISFLKTNIIALDTYWAEYKIAFEMIG
jgi:UDP-glucose 6-dehydrogenase